MYFYALIHGIVIARIETKQSKNIDYSNMNDTFSEQKEKLIAINQEISLLRQQINYLLRNEKPLGLLDLDVLMNRTHTVYDLLCAINLGETSDEEELDLDPEAFAGLFGGMSQETPEETVKEEIPTEEGTKETTEVEEEISTDESQPIVNEVVEEEVVEEPQSTESTPNSDEYGFFFRFEDEPQVEATEPEPVVEQVEEPVDNQTKEPFVDEPIVTDDGKVVHFVEEVSEKDIPARDLVDGDSLVRDNPFEMPRMDDGSEEPDFELDSSETLGESLMREDRSLAAKLQQNPVPDLKSVIGINDKFLFVNELFGGSMEKYNKSIENLNDLKTLNGAMIYLNELKIELQWNSSNEAYQKLAELVRRKFD